MLLRILLLAISLLVGAVGAELPRAAPADVGLSQERLDRITQALESSVDQGHVAGAIGVVARKGKIAYWENVGMADREAGTAMADDTIFRIYSMTKPIVSVALMILYEEGRFSLKDEVKQHIPELGGLKVWAAGKEVAPDREMTVQDLMRHTSGMTYGLFGDSRVDEMYNDAGVLSENQSVAQFVEKLSKLPLKHQPGTQWDYSVSVDVQGRLIEVLSGNDLATYMRERVFEPLDMRDTAFRMTEEKSGRFAQAYKKTEDEKGIEPANDGRTKRYYEKTQWYSGGGGLVSTARDYMRFAEMLRNGGELDGIRILLPETVDLMVANQLPAALSGVAQGERPTAIHKDAPGFGFGKRDHHLGFRGVYSADMHFDDVEVDPADVLVPAGGFRRLMEAFDLERCGNTTMSLAVAQSAFDYVLDYCQQREQFGKPLVDFQAVQIHLAEMKMKLDAARLLLYRAVTGAETRLPSLADSSIAKCFANEAVREVTGKAMQLMGGYGYSREFPIEQKLRDGWGWGIAGGAIDIQKINIASALVGRRFNQRN